MNTETLVVGEFQANCFVVWGDSKEAIVIDPGADAEHILAFIDYHKLSIAAYMLTHGHVDHISATAKLCQQRPAPVGIHPDDLAWAYGPENHFEPFYSVPDKPDNTDRSLSDGQSFTDGGLTYKVISTPGHSPGSVCFYFEDENTLFAGDTLFAGSIGRTDLPGGNMGDMNNSLKLLASFPDETIVYSGHGPSSTIKFEKENNFFLKRQEMDV
ncbi:hypothetical protein BVX97_05005 [bacterium E08(2017)]|nr:hypothetical protein BVX97_05005 [bacterium E08(2017)]